jgi:hypothetical protein
MAALSGSGRGNLTQAADRSEWATLIVGDGSVDLNIVI